ncbi:MAG: PEP/pyruvate-binding domain-containing protein [Myxococcales bacterium]
MSPTPPFRLLGDLRKQDWATAGSKAANLGELRAAGFPVPDGVVVLGPWSPELAAAIRGLGGGPFAVRSSSFAEDLEDRSFAGLYETVLDVSGDPALEAAIERCRRSAENGRVRAYDPTASAQSMAVLVQPMVRSSVSGVAFTANPLTGAPGEVHLTAAAGLGEAVVSGEAVGEAWILRGEELLRTREGERALSPAQARAVAVTARDIERHFGRPQDVEWAFAGGELWVLQARPMTALPEAVEWRPPTPGHWMRDFRIGEWLSGPMTPLFESWLLPRIEEGYLRGMKKTVGAAVPFRWASINGWYYTATPRRPVLLFPRALIESRGRLLRVLLNVLFRVGRNPEKADRKLLRRLAGEWTDELLPRYRAAVARLAPLIEAASTERLVEIVDELGLLAGEALWYLAVVGGSAWKMELCLARFLRRHAPSYERGVQPLLSGLADLPGVQPHAVQSLDWFHETAGELGWAPGAGSAQAREALARQREDAEAEVRRALAGKAAPLARFTGLLEVVRRYGILREQQAADLTLAWPALRRCALRLGSERARAGSLARSEDIFFLQRGELGGADLGRLAVEGRARWTRQRRLSAPLLVGKPSKLLEASLKGAVAAARVGAEGASAQAIWGHPASPGVAIGRVRLVRGPEDFPRFEAGDVLVAAGTAPAWTPLFARAAAVVTDGGSLAAHASLVAREYGIPAVVGTENATRRLHDGQLVLVNGSAGFVEPRPP